MKNAQCGWINTGEESDMLKPSKVTVDYWSALQDKKLKIQICQKCHKNVFYPRPLCTGCGAMELEYEEYQGGITVISIVAPESVAQNISHLIVGELDNGVRLLAPISTNNAMCLQIGARYGLAFLEIDGQLFPTVV